MKLTYDIGAAGPEGTVFNNHADFCVGTGRIGLALQREYFEQLKLVQERIGFKYIRGHGLFNEDMAILQVRRDFTDPGAEPVVEYNFTYLDLVFDGYLELGIRPFIELGFMPKAIASGEQTVFYWQGNVTPPRDYSDWTALVQATLRHLLARYGEDEVLTWPVEVWNEPNLAGFWKDADLPEYLKLFKETILAVKEVNPRLRVGGPAICGVDDENWLRRFLDFVKAEKLPLDFITRHLYCIGNPEPSGRYGYPILRPLADACGETERSRALIDAYPEFRGMEMHVTEFNTSYSPRTPLHDTNLNAAYTAFLLSKLGDDNASYSYWTFGDIFEEQGVPFTPFHGGFGLVANGCITKPVFYAFEFFKALGRDKCVFRSDEGVITEQNGAFRGVFWNLKREELALDLKLPLKNASVIIKMVDTVVCNPLKVWHDMGEPANPSPAQTSLLREAARPQITSARTEDGALSLTLMSDALVYFEAREAPIASDWGFDYDRADKAWD
ncbi:MAG: xylan 1,4-beta-xylosidase [Oscillospiraceae bacterium]|nr:xylan 1,4-beta-xylosidase [Oscillospiraceae bacterium]